MFSQNSPSKPDPNVVAFVSGAPVRDLHVSSVTLAEIRFGIEQVANPNDRAMLATG